jgi:hypothetical protein
MERDHFIFKTHISFSIKSDEIELDIITRELCIEPSKIFKKGDVFTSDFSPRIGHREWNLWTVDSVWTILKEETVNHHIEYFKEILLPKVDVLKKYKKDNRFEISFWIWIETDDAGFGLDLLENDVAFLNDCSNRIHISLLTNTAIDENEVIS